jgi:hypothetical protein
MEHHLTDSGDWSRLIECLGGASALEASARRFKALQRARQVRDAPSLLRLALLHGPGGQSLRAAAALSTASGLAELSDVALLKRLNNAADWLEALCQERMAIITRRLGRRMGRTPIRLVDASRIEGPGDTAWRLHLCIAPQEGRIVDAVFTPLQQGERLDRLAARRGEIRVGDRGYPQPNGLRAMRDAGADVLVRLTWNSLRLTDARQRPLDWNRLLRGKKIRIDMAVRVTKPRGSFEPLPMRMVIVRKPRAAAAAAARRKAIRNSRKDQRRRIDPRTLAAADCMILLTSLDRKAWPPRALVALYQIRWQIELTFKRMKSLLHVDRLRARSAKLGKTWLYAHLLLALLLEEQVRDINARPP